MTTVALTPKLSQEISDLPILRGFDRAQDDFAHTNDPCKIEKVVDDNERHGYFENRHTRPQHRLGEGRSCMPILPLFETSDSGHP